MKDLKGYMEITKNRRNRKGRDELQLKGTIDCVLERNAAWWWKIIKEEIYNFEKISTTCSSKDIGEKRFSRE